MESGDYTRIRHLASPVPADVRDGLTIHRMKRRIDAARAEKKQRKSAKTQRPVGGK